MKAHKPTTRQLMALAVLLGTTGCKNEGSDADQSPKLVEVPTLEVSVTVPSAARLQEYDDVGDLTAKLRDKKQIYTIVLQRKESVLSMDDIARIIEKPSMGSFREWVKKQKTEDGYDLEYESTSYDKLRFTVERVSKVGDTLLSCTAYTEDMQLRDAMREACRTKPIKM